MLPHNEYRSESGKLIRLINDDVLVRMDQLREKTSGGIIIPDTAGDRGDAGILTTGTILAFGFIHVGGKRKIPAQTLPIPDMEVGMKTAFLRYYAEQHSNQQIQYRLEQGVIRMKPLDLLLIFTPDDIDRVLQ